MAKILPFRPAPRKSVDRNFIILLVALPAAAFTAVLLAPQIGPGVQEAGAVPLTLTEPVTGNGPSVHFTQCAPGPRITCVVDGDTIWLEGRKIRMADYNTPEISNPGCEAERRLGQRATTRLTALLNSGAVTLHQTGDRDTDVYGRALREVRVDGRSVGDTLVEEGLAHEWEGYQRDWC